MGTIPGADKKVLAGVLAIVLSLLGFPGIHKFILGYTGAGLIMLLCSILTCWILWLPFAIIGLIEGIIYLTKTDEEFVATYIDGDKPWF
jgi:TM2 domain-containing membrane protein YozV